MTPKEKAKDLFEKYVFYFPEYYNDLEFDYNIEHAKECALIAVEMVISNCYEDDECYWQEVKQEINKL